MAQNEESSKRFWAEFYGPNKGYVEEQYELFLEDPSSVDPSIKAYFDTYGEPVWDTDGEQPEQINQQTSAVSDVKKLTSAIKLVEAIRRYGHLEADIYPVGSDKDRYSKLVDPQTYGLTEEDLKNIPASWIWDHAADANVKNGLDAVSELKKYYTGTIAFEYDHVNNDQERQWLRNLIELGNARLSLSDEEKKQLLQRLVEVEGFEEFLQKTFVGQKRFSIEGLEAMVPMLDYIVTDAIKDNAEHVMMGMAHRGRLSVLAHVLGKPLDKIFSEFHSSPDKDLIPSEGSMGINYGWTGDVKYHFGAVKDVKNEGKIKTRITLANNPSHLEFVNPVIEGFARAAQDDRAHTGYPTQDFNKAIPVQIHGDAAFIGEGIVAETLNLSGLPAYTTGGTLHIIANNLLGYTTDQRDGRSTRYASDLAKGYEIPIIHVNADDPISCVSAVKIAYDYRKKFHKDILIDLVGYRRYGHNEMDEPRATQPTLYSDIDKHPTPAKVYANVLEEKGTIDGSLYDELLKNRQEELRNIYNGMKEDVGKVEPKVMPDVLKNDLDAFETAVPLEKLKAINSQLLNRPEGFNGFKKVERILKRRENMLEEGNKVDWGAGEALAYASILQDGIPIRLTGQDTQRGTFAHRHMVLHDTNTNDNYCPLHGLDDTNVTFDIRNSPLSEAGVLGYEYGYSIQSPKTLVLWEAQFGDFANAAQVIFDQFIAAARAKWGDKSNMVVLLPHGYEGQGPEHSSARLERYLQLAGENNWIVANVTSSAQFFHLIRRQAAMRGKEEARPLILMTPKSLLRNQRVAAPANEFSEGKFMPLRNQPGLKVSKKNAKRLLIGSGKVMVDIEEALEKAEGNFDWLRILRLEQIYPFPEKELLKEIKGMPNLKEIVWVQEEPKNMGAWNFVDDYLRKYLQDEQILRYVGRPDRSSPAVGEPNVHKMEQNQLIQAAINPIIGGDSQ